jgi:zinc finger CCHC domain-containing protein 9
MEDPSTLSKTERRRQARAAKKATLSSLGKPMNPLSAAAKEKKKKAAKAKPVITKEQRKEKYTAKAHELKLLKFEKKTHSKTTCFNCREVGHSAANCPTAVKGAKKICFRCGKDDHRLDDCPVQNELGRGGPLPFASCFVCGEMGHLSGACPQNSKGVYVNGGCCKICGGKDHIESRCPDDTEERRQEMRDEIWREKQAKRAKSLHGPADVRMAGGDGNDDEMWDVDEDKEERREERAKEKTLQQKGKRIVF